MRTFPTSLQISYQLFETNGNNIPDSEQELVEMPKSVFLREQLSRL